MTSLFTYNPFVDTFLLVIWRTVSMLVAVKHAPYHVIWVLPSFAF